MRGRSRLYRASTSYGHDVIDSLTQSYTLPSTDTPSVKLASSVRQLLVNRVIELVALLDLRCEGDIGFARFDVRYSRLATLGWSRT